MSVLPNLQADAPSYDKLARDLASSWRFDVLPPRHPPGWITMLAIVYSIAGVSFVAGKLISWTSLLASMVLCAWLARRVYGTAAAWTAALIAASSPALRGYVGTLQYEVVTGTLLLGTIALAVRTADLGAHGGTAAGGAKAPPLHVLRNATFTGLLAAVLILTRETFVVAMIVVAAWIWMRLRAVDRRRARRAAAVTFVIAIAPAVIWSAMQSVRERRLITISEKGPIVIELGNNPLANGTYNAPLVGIGQPTGLAFVREYPMRSLVLSGRKVLYFWGVLRDGWNVPHPGAVWIWRLTTGLLPLKIIEPVVRGGWLLATFILSLYLVRADRLRTWWVFPAVVCVILAVHIVTLSSYRFAVPVLPLVYVVVSGPISQLAAALGRALRSPAIAVAVALLCSVVVAMQFQAWPLQVEYAATELDGIAADNATDTTVLHTVRLADARRGERPVVLLPDEYLPRGPLIVAVRARRLNDQQSPSVPIARAALVQLDGQSACSADLLARQVPTAFQDVVLSCQLSRDGPATLIVYSLGQVDLAFDRVALIWQ